MVVGQNQRLRKEDDPEEEKGEGVIQEHRGGGSVGKASRKKRSIGMREELTEGRATIPLEFPQVDVW